MLCVRLDDTLEYALSLSRHRVWRHLPVLDYWGRLHSILDVRDAVQQVVGSDGKFFWRGKTAADVLAGKRRKEVYAAATAPPTDAATWQAELQTYLRQHARAHTISARASVEAAARQMMAERMTFLTVVDDAPDEAPADASERGDSERGAAEGGAAEGGRIANHVIGFVTERSFTHLVSEWHHGVRTLDPTTCMPVDASAHQPPPPAPRAPGGVAALMTPLHDVQHISLLDPATDAIDLFFSKNVTHLPVIDRHQRLMGIISVADLLSPLIDSLDPQRIARQS